MNYQVFTDEGGFRLNTGKLLRLQDSFSIFNAFGALVGHELAIIKGCEIVGAQVNDGYVWINGELLPFEGGALGTNVIIEDTAVNETFNNGVVNDVYHTRKARFGTSITSFPWSNFVRAYPMSSSLYVGKVDMFSGPINNIPWGWYLCNGQNGTPDLRGKFIAGYNPDDPDYNTIGKTGGEKEVTLTVEQLAKHAHKQGSEGLYNDYEGGSYVGSRTYPSGNHPSYRNQNTDETGGDQPHENRPPYYTLAFIYFKGQ